jgi:hypothetical protein
MGGRVVGMNSFGSRLLVCNEIRKQSDSEAANITLYIPYCRGGDCKLLAETVRFAGGV